MLELKRTQKERVLAYLQQGHRITPAKAMFMFKVQRLAAVIDKLKNDGHSINTNLLQDLEGCRYAEYSLA